MIIECPACTSRYRIREDKLPENGGNIKCPSCAHVFFVPRGDSAAPVDPAATEVPSALGTSRPAQPTPGAAPAVAAGGPGPAAKRWKLKNPVGLVYDFPDSDQLRTWLGSRESFDSILISSDGGVTWASVEDVAELAGVRASGRKASIPPGPLSLGGASPDTRGNPPSGQYATTADKMREEAEARLRESRAARAGESSAVVPVESFRMIKPPANKQQEQTSKVLLLLAVLILPFIAAIGLHLVGVINLADYGLLPPDNTPPPVAAQVQQDAAPSTEDAPVRQERELTPEQVVSVLVDQAGAAQSRGEPAAAAEALERAVEVMPDDNELHCLLQPIYVELGRQLDAERAAERCQATEPAEGSAAPVPEGAVTP